MKVTPKGQTPPSDFIQKGSRVHVKFLRLKEPGTFSLAGVQPKGVADWVEFTGTVRHIRGNDPIAPTDVRLWVEPDGAGEDIPVCEKCGSREIGMIKIDHAALLVKKEG